MRFYGVEFVRCYGGGVCEVLWRLIVGVCEVSWRLNVGVCEVLWRLVVAGAGAEDATAAEVEFVWSAGEEGSHTECVLADEELVQAAWLTRFKQPGLHTIGRLSKHLIFKSLSATCI